MQRFGSGADEGISAMESIFSDVHGEVRVFFTKRTMAESSMADDDRSLRRGLPYARARTMGGGTILTFKWFRTRQDAKEAISRLPKDYPRQFLVYLPHLDTEGPDEANQNPKQDRQFVRALFLWRWTGMTSIILD